MISEQDRQDAREIAVWMFAKMEDKAALKVANIRAEAVNNARAEDHMRRWNYDKTDDGLRVCFGEHDRSADCEYVYYVPKSSVDDAVKSERKKWEELLLQAMVFVRVYAYENPRWTPVGMSEQDPNGVHAFIKRVSTILSDDQEANRG